MTNGRDTASGLATNVVSAAVDQNCCVAWAQADAAGELQ